jgi:hypothetical protein
VIGGLAKIKSFLPNGPRPRGLEGEGVIVTMKQRYCHLFGPVDMSKIPVRIPRIHPGIKHSRIPSKPQLKIVNLSEVICEASPSPRVLRVEPTPKRVHK